ncbi:hypothetical protein GCM10011509_20630 [Ornithinimicrobium pekingense]|uniref:Uncharacterized protein n=1 Tax=Ornithinimicrobium pekingense TaxID=384677 RepID=A0ABQ2FBQ7_9MICO|nr:hypothetical protein GCM10011509_20630 [Ornithinimicrobium pekingense]
MDLPAQVVVAGATGLDDDVTPVVVHPQHHRVDQAPAEVGGHRVPGQPPVEQVLLLGGQGEALCRGRQGYISESA